jgi:hypothetical protein
MVINSVFKVQAFKFLFNQNLQPNGLTTLLKNFNISQAKTIMSLFEQRAKKVGLSSQFLLSQNKIGQSLFLNKEIGSLLDIFA